MTGRIFRNSLTALLFVLLAALSWLHFATPINLLNADLGRHICNGELFFKTGQILTTNFYSYTAPNMFAPCHHWGIGVIFYALWKAWSFIGLSWAYTGLLLATFAVALWQGRREASAGALLLAGVLMLPLVGYRTEIRPEGVSTFFLAIEFLILERVRRKHWSVWALVVFPLIQILWVNIHILFFCGFLLIFCYLTEALLTEGWSQQSRLLASVLFACVAVSFINPFVLNGGLFSAPILNGYDYKLAENQNVFYMMKRFPDRNIYGYYCVAFGSTLGLVLLQMFRERCWRPYLAVLLAVIIFGVMGLKAVRAISMAAFVFIPAVALTLSSFVRDIRWLRRGVIILGAVLVLLAVTVPSFYFSPLRAYRGSSPKQPVHLFFWVLSRPDVWGGLSPGVEDSARFFKVSGMRGPIFNNYDIGGYLIFNFFPQERPFVDNRPEAYPEPFFREIYGPMQQNEAVWERMSREYGFEAIYFYRHDRTEWGQSFLIRRLNDPNWAPVYVDAYTLILARRGGRNQRVIDQYALPKNIFSVNKANGQHQSLVAH